MLRYLWGALSGTDARSSHGVPVTKVLETSWQAMTLWDGSQLVREVSAPRDVEPLADRARSRRVGQLTPEESEMLALRGAEMWETADRRLAAHGLRWNPAARSGSETSRETRGPLRAFLLADAERSLVLAWDPSVHVEEAVRAASDLDRVKNLVGERLGSWTSRDAPEVDPGDHARAVARALGPDEGGPLAPAEPSLRAARRALAELYRSIEAAQTALTAAVERSAPARAPNLSALLGPELAARLVAQAGGLDRLARLPASTVQVLGAERAFFEHLRGHAPPPRHGLLFLHPTIQSAPRVERGKLARALAGKVAIAARLDHGNAPVDPSLAQAYERRRSALRQRRGARPRTRPSRRSAAPLHGAAGDR